MKTLKEIIAVFAVASLSAMAGCNKEESPVMGYMAVNMTESRQNIFTPPSNPDLTAVNLDITSVEVHYASGEASNDGWVKLSTNAGIYDLLKLQYDVMATVASSSKLPVGTINQIRLVLGENNAVFISLDSKHLLTVPSREIKINVNTAVEAGKQLVVTLDFDADRSIVMEGHGTFTLKPVIKVKSTVH